MKKRPETKQSQAKQSKPDQSRAKNEIQKYNNNPEGEEENEDAEGIEWKNHFHFFIIFFVMNYERNEFILILFYIIMFFFLASGNPKRPSCHVLNSPPVSHTK